MAKNDNMPPTLTRRDLHEVLDERLANHPTHAQLATALAHQRAEIAGDMAAAHAALLEQVRAENAVLLEDAFKRFRVIDDQYKDLPGRVEKLEEVVFPPTPRTRRKRSG